MEQTFHFFDGAAGNLLLTDAIGTIVEAKGINTETEEKKNLILALAGMLISGEIDDIVAVESHDDSTKFNLKGFKYHFENVGKIRRNLWMEVLTNFECDSEGVPILPNIITSGMLNININDLDKSFYTDARVICISTDVIVQEKAYKNGKTHLSGARIAVINQIKTRLQDLDLEKFDPLNDPNILNPDYSWFLRHIDEAMICGFPIYVLTTNRHNNDIRVNLISHYIGI